MKKKIFAILLGSLLSASMLAGCGGSNDTATETPAPEAPASSEAPTGETAATGDAVIRVGWWGNQVRNEGTTAALNLYSEQNPGITFEPEFSDWNGYWDKMATQAAAGSMPDIIQQDYKYIAQYKEKGQLASLTPYVENGTLNLDDANDGIIASGTMDDQLYALCIGINAPAMVYDPDVLAEAGVEIPETITYEELIELGDKVFEATGVKYEVPHGIDGMEYWMRGDGIAIFGDGKLNVESADQLVPYFKTLENSTTDPAHISMVEYSEYEGMGLEQSQLSTGFNWNQFAFSNQVIAFNTGAGKDLKIMAWPQRADATSKQMYLKPSQFFSLSETSTNKEEAAKFLDFFTNDVEANKLLKAERGVPLSSKVAEEIKPVLDPASQGVIDYVNEVSDISGTINPPVPEGYAEVLRLATDTCFEVRYGQLTAEEAAEQFFTKSNEILAK